ncbi:MAG: hypothetical protein V3S69_02490 [Dehalococcoidales bacterium]
MEVIGFKVNPGTREISASTILISVLFLTIGILSIFIGVRRYLLIKKKAEPWW